MTSSSYQQDYQAQLAKLSSSQKQALAKKLGLKENKSKTKLVACVTMQNNQAVSSKQLKEAAQAVLPEQFTPQVFKQVEALPKTPAGKVDRKHAQRFAWQELPEFINLGEKELEVEGLEVKDLESNADIDATEKVQSTDNTQSNYTEQDSFADDDFDIFGDSQYIAPTNETEEILAGIWSDVLGVGDISIHDEFIEVGGDSLLSIRILARINKAGLSIATEDFFEYPTIAGQAKAISKASENSYEQGSTKGKFALIPIQHWLFERVKIDTHHWNQSVLLSVDEQLDFASLERAFQKVIQQHDALRLSFVKRPTDSTENKWQQAYLPVDSQLPIEHFDVSHESGNQQKESIEHHCQTINKSMDLGNGQLVKLAFFKTGDGEANALAVIAHHLVIDAESWRILLEDLQSCWVSFAKGNMPDLPRKTTSFKHWSEKLAEYAQSQALLDELDYWQAQTSKPSMPTASKPSIPTDYELTDGQNNEGSTKVHTTVLDRDTTEELMQSATKKLGVGVRDLLVSALALVIQKWSQHDKVLLDIEGHGREDLFEKVDISRTIGWFTSVFPTVFTLEPSMALSDALLKVTTTLKAIPNNGIGHGILRDISQDEQLKQQTYSQVCFNYLGQIDAHENTHNDKAQNAALNLLEHNIGQTRSALCLRAFYLEINAKVQKGQLHIDWSYSQNLHKSETIETLAHHFDQTLNDLLSLDALNSNKSMTEGATSDDFDDDMDDDLFDLADDEMAAISKALGDSANKGSNE
jgi:non-ribosomal peptide synthase protein (TIGR01720 family)